MIPYKIRNVSALWIALQLTEKCKFNIENAKIQIGKSEIKILSKIVSLLVKLAIKCIPTSRKEKFNKHPVVILFKNGCSVRQLGDRMWALEIAYWKLCLYGKLFCIRQTSQFYRVSVAELSTLWKIYLKNFT